MNSKSTKNGLVTSIGKLAFCLLLTFTTLCSSHLQAQYCSSAATSAMDGDIGNIVFNGVTHVSTCATTGGGASVQNLYSDYTGLGTFTSFNAGDNVGFQIEMITCGGVFGYGVAVYIDYNRNNSLTDAGELAYVTTNLVSAGNTLVGGFTIPNNVVTGATLMRIVAIESANASNITPCGTYIWGETEDYTVMLGSPITAVITDASCGGSDGQIDISYTNVNATAPYTYAWSNGATTEDLTGLPAGAYTVIITDALGLTAQSTFYVNASNLAANASTVTPTCFANNGAISINPTGGTAPYTIQWSNGQTGNSISNLVSGGYSVNITDANGCFMHQVFNLTVATSCYVQIGGNVYYDVNNNCVQDTGEVGVPYATITVDDLNSYSYNGAITPGATGNYLVVADTGSYNVMANLPSAYMSIGCAGANNVTVPMPNYGMTNTAVNFPVSIPTVQDLKVSLMEGPYVPGFNHQTNINYRNAGTIATNATITYNYAPSLHNLVFSVPPTTLDTINRVVTWNAGLLPILSNWINIHITAYIDTAGAVIGAAANSSVIINPLANDYVPADNEVIHVASLMASFDPNIKEVSPVGVTEHGLVDATTNTFHYTVQFQNTGNYMAQFVVIKDSIPADLNIASLEFEGASHACDITIENERLLVFRFNNINLPDSNSNEPESHGFVSFALKVKNGTAPFTALRNKAGIYFDFNAPVITNEVVNTLYLFPTLNLNNVITVCETDNVSASINGGLAPYSFAWSNGTTQNNNQTGTATQVANTLTTGANTISVTDVYGYTIAQNFNLTTVAPAVATFTQTQLSANSYQLTASNPNYTSYLWDLGNGQSSTIYNPIANYTNAGTYNVTLTVQNLCGAVSDMHTLDITSDIDNANFGVQVATYPNPFTQSLNFDFPNPTAATFTLEISDASGKTVESIQSKQAHIQVSTEKLASGIYFWKLSGDKAASGTVEKK